MKKHHGLIELAMVHWRIVVTLVSVLVVYGTVCLLTMPRQEFPQFTVRQGLVVGVMPGATSAQVEEKLTKPLEDYLFSFKEVNKAKTYSMSQDGRVIVMVELSDEVSGPDSPLFWAKLRHGLNEFRGQKLPSQVLALVGDNDFGDTSALIFTLVAEGHNPRDLEKQIEVLEDHLRRIPATSKLRRFGQQQEVIRVTISRERLARYAVRPATVWLTLQGLGGAPAPARLDAESLEMPIHVRETLHSERDLGDTILLSDPTGSQVRLRDVATLTREYGHDDSFVRFNGKTALVLSIEMQPGNNITRFGSDVDVALADARRELPPGVEIARVVDQPQVVRTSVGHFLRDFGIAIAAVILVTMLLLPLRVASVAALTIPISILSTLGILNVLNVELQTVSLAGLIVVLGMVVDNAIVVVDDHVEHLDHGVTPWKAAWKSAGELTMPVFTATLAIVMAYVPMALFMNGMGKDFIGSLPLTIGVALGVSFLAAVFLVPILNNWFIKRGLHRADGKDKWTFLIWLERRYDKWLDVAFTHPWLTIAIGVGSVVVGVLLMLAVPQQLFPKVERNQFAVEVYLPAGRPLGETDRLVRRLETMLQADRRVTNVTSFIGTGSPRFHTVYAPNMPARSYAQLIVNTVDQNATEAVLDEFYTRTRGAFPEGYVRWKQLDFQATPAPVEVRISGRDLGTLKKLADEIGTAAKRVPGSTWVRTDFGEALQGVDVVPDLDAAARFGVPPASLQLSLAVGSRAGMPVGTIWEGDYPVKVVLGEDPEQPASIEALRQQYVSSALMLAPVPLDELATLKPSWSDETIMRRNGVRTLTVRVDVGREVLASSVQQEIERFVATLGELPSGVRIEYGGEKEAMGEQYGPLATSLVTSVVIIYLILLFQFGRHRKAMLVMLTMPLSLFGAILGLYVLGFPFGMTSFVGIISLMGIVVRSGIILVSYAEGLQIDKGMSGKEAGIAAGKRRMRPIFLTSAAAAVGVVPLILSGSTLWGPFGTVTCFGLLFSMALTLFVLPVAYWKVADTPGGHPGVRPAGAAVAGLLMLALAAGPASAQEAPLTLEQCRALTLQNNVDIRSADLSVVGAEAMSKAARTKYYPQVAAGAMALAAATPMTEIATHAGNLPVFDGSATTSLTTYMPASSMAMMNSGYAAGITAMQPLYAGGRITTGNRLASLGVDVARENVTMARRDALALTEEKYWRVVELAEKQNTLEAYDALLKALEAQARDAVAAGLATPNDLLKVTVQRQKVDVDRARLVSGIRLSARDLRRHIGLPEGDAIGLADALAPPQAPALLEEARRGGVERRPEARQLERAVEAERFQIALKRGEMLPTVSAGVVALRYDFSGLESVNDVAVVGMVTVPISARREVALGIASLRAREQIAQNRLDSTKRLLELEIEKRWDDLRIAWRAADVADAAIEQSELNLREAKDRNSAGMSTLSDVLEAEVLLRRAQDERTEVRRDYWLARAAYLRAVGREDLT